MSMSLSRTGAIALLTLAIVTPAAQAIETGYDSITTPGRPVGVGGKFERRGLSFVWRPDVRGKAATVEVLGRRLPSRTDADGVALATVTPSSVGVFPVEARVGTKVARGRLWVLDPTRPVAVCDIDGTLSDMPDWMVPFAGHKARTFPGAPQLVRDLAATHQLVYLTARDDTFDRGTRAFLARHGYPDAPIIYDDLGLRTRAEREQLKASNHGRFKLSVLQALAGRGVPVTLGIGNAETDAWAYEQFGVPSYINTKKTGTGPSFRFDDYAVLRARLVADRVLATGLATAIP